MLRVALVIAMKDLRQRLRDRSAIILAIVIPFALTFIFAQSLADVSGGEVTFDYAIADLDGGPLSQAFIGVMGELEAQEVVRITTAESRDAAIELAGDDDVEASFVIPAGFSDAVNNNEQASIEVFGNVDRQIATTVAEAIAEGFLQETRAIQASISTAALNLGDVDMQTLAERAAAFPNAINVEDVSASRKELDANTFYAAGMAVFFLFFTVQFGVTGLLEERKEGTMRRLLVAPARRGSILLGKLLTGFILGVVSMAVLATASTFLLDADWGSAVGVGILILAGVIAAVSITALVASLANTVDQAGTAQTIIALVFGMLGGAFFPVAQAGGVIERLSFITPHAWFLRGLSDLQSDGAVSDIWPSVLALLIFATITGGAASMRLGKAVRA